MISVISISAVANKMSRTSTYSRSQNAASTRKSRIGGAHRGPAHTMNAVAASTMIDAAARKNADPSVLQAPGLGRTTRLATMLAAISATTTPSARKTGILKMSINSIFVPMKISTSARP